MKSARKWSGHLKRPSLRTRRAPVVKHGSADHGFTVNFLLLVSVPPPVVTSTKPVVAPVGTMVVISDAETTVNVAAAPLNVTVLAPVRLLPRILTAAPTFPA